MARPKGQQTDGGADAMPAPPDPPATAPDIECSAPEGMSASPPEGMTISPPIGME